jgi:hypothetical protein
MPVTASAAGALRRTVIAPRPFATGFSSSISKSGKRL